MKNSQEEPNSAVEAFILRLVHPYCLECFSGSSMLESTYVFMRAAITLWCLNKQISRIQIMCFGSQVTDRSKNQSDNNSL